MMEIFETAALEAGKAILAIHRRGPTTRYKTDCSPVTEADERAEEIILAHLSGAFPEIPVVAEESVAAGRIPSIAGRSFILVDPLDGTKEFVNRHDDFTVNIALIEEGRPVAGIVYAPARNVAYIGSRDGAYRLRIAADFEVVERSPIHVREAGNLSVAVASRSHNSPQTEEFLRKAGIHDTCLIGSSLKFCLVAEGQADLYPRFSRTMEWDTAAGDAVLRAAGGSTVTPDGVPLAYGKTRQADDADFANPHFIAYGSKPG